MKNMKNKLVITGLVFAGLATIFAIVGTCFFNESSGLTHQVHLVSDGFFMGLFSIMCFVGSKLYKE